MRRTVLLLAPVLALLAGCAPEPVAPLADHGIGALGQPVTSISQAVAHVREKTEGCTDPRPGTARELAELVGAQLRERYEPYVSEWVSCSVPPNYPKIGVLLFAPGKLIEFQKGWRDAMAGGAVTDGPVLGFGNGFAVTSSFLGVYQLDLYYLRCHYRDEKVPTIRADVPDCVFTRPPHHQH